MTDKPLDAQQSSPEGRESAERPTEKTDAEVICEFMEPMATIECTSGGKRSMLDWWRRETEWSDSLKWKPWTPCRLTLDALWEVEERLSQDQARLYVFALVGATDLRATSLAVVLSAIHATTHQKIQALALSLRSRANPGDDAKGPQADKEKSDG